MNTFSGLFCLCFLGFYTLLLLGLSVLPLFGYGRLSVLSRRKHTSLRGMLKSSSFTERADASQDHGANISRTATGH